MYSAAYWRKGLRPHIAGLAPHDQFSVVDDRRQMFQGEGVALGAAFLFLPVGDLAVALGVERMYSASMYRVRRGTGRSGLSPRRRRPAFDLRGV